MLRAIKFILRRLAQLTILRYRPAIVGVTGSVGKTSTKLAIAAVLSAERSVRASKGNFNSEIGISLSVLGDWKKEDLRLLSRDLPPGRYPFRKAGFFIKVILVSIWNLVGRTRYPEVLVLEYGIDRPGDMRELLSIARPNIAILTAIGTTPAHVEFFPTAHDVAKEKGRLIEAVPSTGYVILNTDDDTIMKLRPRTRAQLMTFGFAKDATVQTTQFENRAEGERPLGATFKLENNGSFVPVRLDGSFGKSNAYSASAAACVGLIFGMNLVSIAAALESYYRPAPHRMELVPGVKGIWIIDDSYNAGPLSMRSALETLDDLPAKRKIAVLGDMLEIGQFAMEEHEKLGRFLSKIADVLITVGPHAKFIAEGARKAGFAKKNIFEYDSAEDAKSPIQTFVQHGDLVLVKSSHAIHLDRIVAGLRSLEEVSGV
jgi:UDP-N-acetylmuramoyl-tripeptide--D-alanyl-D-alanine ligase